MEFAFEATTRLRVGFVGAGGHSYRNVYPALQYAPVELVALADHHPEKASAYARQFGAERWYTDHREMLQRERLDAVFLCLNFDQQGRPRYPAVAEEAMRAGCHVWMEKPPAASTAEVEQMQQVSRETGRHVAVGYKKMFFPSYEKARQIIGRPEFGEPSTAAMRYRLALPAPERRDDRRAWTGFMDICHPGAALHALFGPVAELWYRRAGQGGVCAVLTYASGVIVSLHLTGG
jgi:predicted dehydrogenase